MSHHLSLDQYKYTNYHSMEFAKYMNTRKFSLREAQYKALNDCVGLYMKENCLNLLDEKTIEFIRWIEKHYNFKEFPSNEKD